MDAFKFIELSKNIVTSVDFEGNFVYVNPAFCNLLGYTKDDLEGKKLMDFVHPEDVESTEIKAQSLLETDDLQNFENRYLCKDGSVKYFSWNASSVQAESLIYAIGNDITERKETELKLRQSSELLEASQSIAGVGGWELNLVTGELFWTAEVYRIHDADPEDFDPSLDAGIQYYLPESQPILLEALRRAIEHGERYDLELQLKTVKGRIIDVRTTCKVTLKDGRSTKLTGAFQDITEKKNAERELIKAKEKAEERENYINNIINKTGDPLFVKDDQSRLTLVNDAFCTLFKLSKDDILGKTLAEDVAPEEREHFLKIDKEVLATGQENVVEESLTLHESATRIISTRKTRFVDNDGNKFLVGTIRDITENIRAQEEIKNSEEKFSNAFENAPYPISILNINTGELIGVNKSFSEFFGYSKQELLEGNIHLKNLCQNQDEFFNGITILKKEGALEQFPFVMKTKPGDTKMMLVNATKFLASNNDLIIASFMDVTVQKEREKALEQSDRVFNVALDMFCIAGFDGYFKYLNPAWERTLGWSTAELMAKPWLEYVYPEDKSKTENVETVLVDGKEVYQFENRYMCKDGSVKWLSWNSQPYADEGIMIGAARDITESKRIESQLIEAKIRAEESDRLKSAFLANMSHEIRTPMNGVIGFSDLLKNDDLTLEERHRYLEIVDRNSKQLLNLIDDIIDVAKMESEQLKISLKSCELDLILSDLEETFNEIKLVSGKPNLEFVAHVPDDFKDLAIITDCVRLRQVLTNLLNNAVKFSEKGTVSFGFNIKQNDLIFYVKDQGIGMSEDNLDKIFERFKQIDQHDEVNHKGSGLGLSICKGIIDLLGGTISVKSELNVGTEFTFTIPYVQGVRNELIKRADPNGDNSLEGKTILIAEDGQTARLYFKVALEKTKAKLLFANNGQIAVDLFKSHPEIDLVMMDIGMPIMNGFEAMSKILEYNHKAKIIAQTAYAMTNEKEKCFELGCIDYLTKPIDKTLLIKTIEKWID